VNHNDTQTPHYFGKFDYTTKENPKDTLFTLSERLESYDLTKQYCEKQLKQMLNEGVYNYVEYTIVQDVDR
jgi:hypothetical protein